MIEIQTESYWAKTHLKESPKSCIACPFSVVDLGTVSLACSLLNIQRIIGPREYTPKCTPYDFIRYLLEVI